MNLKNNDHVKLSGDQSEYNYKSFSKWTKLCPVLSDILKNILSNGDGLCYNNNIIHMNCVL